MPLATQPTKHIRSYLPGIGKVYYPVLNGQVIRVSPFKTATEAAEESDRLFSALLSELNKAQEAVSGGMIPDTSAVGSPSVIQTPPPET